MLNFLTKKLILSFLFKNLLPSIGDKVNATKDDITIENDIIPQIPATIPEIDDDLLEIDTVDNNFLLEEENEEDQENTESDLNLVDDDNNLRDLFTTNVKTDPIVLQLLEKHGTLTAEELAKELNEFMQFIKDRD